MSLFGKNNSVEGIDFVILASQRTGSNMLVSLLDAYPGVRCHGELFRKKGQPKAGALKILDELPSEYEDPDYRAENYSQYLHLVRNLSEDNCYFGFKLMLNQAPLARQALIRKSPCKIVFLYRENLLAVHSSNLIAKATGQGNLGSNQPVKSKQVEFVESRFDWFCKQLQRGSHEARLDLEEFASGRFMEISYLELCRPEGKVEVENFLGIAKPPDPVMPATAKRNSSRIIDRFSNPQVVIDYLQRTGKSSWIEESLE